MDRVYLKQQTDRLKANYGDRFDMGQEVFDLWSEIFADCVPEGFKASVDEYMRTNEFPPSIASIRKIYDEKKAYREELAKFLTAKYRWVTCWFEEEPDKEAYKMFVDYVCRFPKQERKKVAQDIAYDAVAWWNDCIERGVPLSKIGTFKDYLKGKDE